MISAIFGGHDRAADMSQTVDFDIEKAHDEMIANARSASSYLKAISNETRLIILCHLVVQPRSVGELESLVGVRQANVSQHLARLKEDGLVQADRHGKSVEYSIADDGVQQIMMVLYNKFCGCD